MFKDANFALVTPEVNIRKRSCHCNSANVAERDACKFTVLDNIKPKKFSVPPEKPTLWNLALLGTPKHPDFDTRVEDVKNASWLSIETEPEGV